MASNPRSNCTQQVVQALTVFTSDKLKKDGSSPEGVTSLPVVSTTGIAAK